MTYEYECPCGHRWEATQRISDEPLRGCPACGAETARRLISGGGGFALQGGGWYRDGYSQGGAPGPTTAPAVPAGGKVIDVK